VLNLRSIFSDKRSVKLINMEQWWNDNETVKSKDFKKILSHLYFVHHKPKKNWPVIDIHLNYTQPFSSYPREHTVRVHYESSGLTLRSEIITLI
jgi:hypothetical protein